MNELRSALAAIQPAFQDGKVLQIEVTHDDVCVYLREGMGRKRFDTGRGLEANMLEAVESARAPQKG